MDRGKPLSPQKHYEIGITNRLEFRALFRTFCDLRRWLILDTDIKNEKKRVWNEWEVVYHNNNYAMIQRQTESGYFVKTSYKPCDIMDLDREGKIKRA